MTKPGPCEYKRYLVVPRAKEFFVFGPTNRPIGTYRSKEKAIAEIERHILSVAQQISEDWKPFEGDHL